jgi:flavodoxin
MPSTDKILVVYYSKSGVTERVAKEIAAKMNADIEKIIDKKSRKGLFGWIFGARDAKKKIPTEIVTTEKDPAKYDIVIVGTPIWAWDMVPAVRTYIEQNKSKLKDTAVFTTAGNTKSERIVASMEELTGKRAIASTDFCSKELKDSQIYDTKISAFIKSILDNHR